MALIPRKLTPEEAKEAAESFKRIHARAREEAGKDPNHPYNAYLWAINGGLDAVMEEKAKTEKSAPATPPGIEEEKLP